MKKLIQLFTITIFLISSSYSFSLPLNGTYTIGSNGDYPTINSALNDAMTGGIDGPVIFNIFPGVYYEHILIWNEIPGNSSVNTLTLRSQSGNSADVKIDGTGGYDIPIYTSNIIFEGLSVEISSPGIIIFTGENIKFINNDFNNSNFRARSHSDASDIYFTGNVNIGNMELEGADFNFDIGPIYIQNNVITGYIDLYYCYGIITGNTINTGIGGFYSPAFISKNRIKGFFAMDRGSVFNNFIIGEVYLYLYVENFINNTIVGGSLSSPTISSNAIRTNLKNNIIVNPLGGTALYSVNEINSDYNDLYNGGNNNLIYYRGFYYDNISDFYNSSGIDGHSNSLLAEFASLTDLHLGGISIGNDQMKGIPDPLVTDDIDGQPRDPFYPYKGADEIPEYPLPVELSSFSSAVTNNNVQLNWTTLSEVNNSGYDIERLLSENSKLSNAQWLKVGFVSGHNNSVTNQDYNYTDKNLPSGKFKYRLKQIDYNGNYKYYDLANEVEIGLPVKFSLSQNFPNPFNPSTVIRYQLNSGIKVTLKIYDITGKEVMTLLNEFKDAGSYDVRFDGSDLSSGVYFYKLDAGNFSEIKKMTLIK